LLPIVLILFAAALLRWHGLAQMDGMMMYDEAYNGWDALQSMESGRLTPFLLDNNGRESGWHYWLMPFLATLGARPLAIHFAASVAGILTIAAVYRLGRELVNRRVGIWSAFGLTVLYWHVHLSHMGLRAIMLPLVGASGLTMLLLAKRKNQMAMWGIAGLLTGLLAYTYFSAWLWVAFSILVLLVWFRRVPVLRRGVTLAFVLTAIVSFFQAWFIIQYPDKSFFRIRTVAVITLDQIGANILDWALALFERGDATAAHNLALRPVLDAGLALPFLAGSLGLLLLPDRRRGAGWIIGLSAFSLAPSIFSDFAPHFLRAVGLVVPLALLIGVGSDILVKVLRPRIPGLAVLIPCTLMAYSFGSTYQDFGTWLQDDRLLSSMETYANQSAGWIRRNVPPDSGGSVYFSPFNTFHPVIAFHSYGLAPIHVAGFGSGQCLVLAESPVYYVVVPAWEPAFEQSLLRWSEATVRFEADRQFGGEPLYRIYESGLPEGKVDPFPEAQQVRFEQNIRLSHGDVGDVFKPGDRVSIDLAFSTEQPTPFVTSAFVHLYGDPTPYEGGRLWAQDDSWICEPYPSTVWRADEVIVQAFHLNLPTDLPEGSYQVAAGIHEAPAGPRLSLGQPVSNPYDYFVLGEIRVVE
jgi:4-amino-4-deoxy-L-arabinose transferase-like glycosyltransferase